MLFYFIFLQSQCFYDDLSFEVMEILENHCYSLDRIMIIFSELCSHLLHVNFQGKWCPRVYCISLH